MNKNYFVFLAVTLSMLLPPSCERQSKPEPQKPIYWPDETNVLEMGIAFYHHNLQMLDLAPIHPSDSISFRFGFNDGKCGWQLEAKWIAVEEIYRLTLRNIRFSRLLSPDQYSEVRFVLPNEDKKRIIRLYHLLKNLKVDASCKPTGDIPGWSIEYAKEGKRIFREGCWENNPNELSELWGFINHTFSAEFLSLKCGPKRER